jgi:hypothetical protein
MPRIKVDFYKVCGAFPEAEQIRVLPRKKKKALKKKIGQMLIDLLSYESHQIMAQIMEEKIFEETLEKIRDLETTVNKI